MRRFCLFVVAIASLVLVSAFTVAATVVLGGLSTRREPNAVERFVARTVRRLAVPRSARERTGPFPTGDNVVAQGLEHFADHCSGCHANDGSGNTAMGRGLYPRAPDLRGDATQSQTDGELFYVIEEGVPLTGMPGWSVPGGENATWALVQFIRHLPRLSADERVRMERLNPRSAAEWNELREEDEFLERGSQPAPHAKEHP